MQLSRTPTDELIADLRDDAEDLAHDLDGIPAHETIAGQSAQTLEEYHDALARIARGEAEPKTIAERALRLDAPLRPIGDPADTIRGLLTPKRL